MGQLGNEPWRRYSACLGFPPSWFFPERADKASAEEVAAFAARGIIVTSPPPRNDTEAKRICARCPVAAECMATAVIANEEYGVWAVGGQRRRYLRQQYLSLSRRDFVAVVQAEVELLRTDYRRLEVKPLERCARCAKAGVLSWLPEGTRPEDMNGANARCGVGVTYARGCRCWPCRLAHAARIRHRHHIPQPEDHSNDQPSANGRPRDRRDGPQPSLPRGLPRSASPGSQRAAAVA